MNDALESKGAASADGQIAAKSGMFAPLAELFHNHLKALMISFGARGAERGRLLHRAHLPADLSV